MRDGVWLIWWIEGGSTRWGQTAIHKNEYSLGKCQLLQQMHRGWYKGGIMGFARLVRAELDALADDVNKLPNCKQISRTARPVYLHQRAAAACSWQGTCKIRGHKVLLLVNVG